MTRENIADIYAVQTKANELTCEEFVEWVKNNASKYQDKCDILEFVYNSISCIANIKKGFLQGYFEYYKADGDYGGNLYCKSVEFN